LSKYFILKKRENKIDFIKLYILKRKTILQKKSFINWVKKKIVEIKKEVALVKKSAWRRSFRIFKSSFIWRK